MVLIEAEEEFKLLGRLECSICNKRINKDGILQLKFEENHGGDSLTAIVICNCSALTYIRRTFPHDIKFTIVNSGGIE